MTVLRAFGKKPVRHDGRNLKLSTYLTALPPVPSAIAWGAAITDWPMMKNDTVGDCAFASAGHIEQMFTTVNGNALVPTDQQILAAYSAVTGYDPNNPASDQGTVLLDALNYWRKTGIAGRQIESYVEVNPQNEDQTKAAIFLLGAVYGGVQLPASAMDQVDRNEPWTVARHDGGIEGGHAIPLVGYDGDGPICITWGQVQRMTWAWWAKYSDEAYAVLAHDWYPSGLAPNHFNYAQLVADAAAL